MMNEEQIKKRIDEILDDERIWYKTADIHTNAFLALIQLSLETELHTLERVLGVELTDIKLIRNEK